MSSNRGNNRRRGRGNNRQQGGQHVNRIDSRARGNAPQLLEKYRKLAHDAHLNGERVLEEYYLQFADHYFRVIADTRQRQEDTRQRRDERWQEGNEDGGEGNEYGTEAYGAGFGDAEAARVRESDDRADEERESEGRDESRADQDRDGDDGQRSVFEPTENPFVRDNRSVRGTKPRRPRRTANNDGEGEEVAGLDPASLPPSISSGREEAAAAEPEAADDKPRRRTRRKPSSDDNGEALQSVG